MSLEITAQQVRDICPTIMATDANLDLLILGISCKVDTCLAGSYVDCPDLARAIKINTVCHFAMLATQSGQLTSQKYANGAAKTFSNYTEGGRGLNGTNFGESILALDSAGCINAAFPSSQRQFIRTAGTSGSQDRGFY